MAPALVSAWGRPPGGAGDAVSEIEKKRIDLRTRDQPQRPSLRNLAGGAPASQHWFASVLAAQDHVVAGSHRVVADWTAGGDDLGIPDTAPSTIGSAVYFLLGQNRDAVSSRYLSAPGCTLEYHALYLPAGPTQKAAGSNYVLDEHGGAIRFVAKWDNGTSSETLTLEEETSPSTEEHGGVADTAGAYWYTMREAFVTESLTPAVEYDDDALEDYVGEGIQVTTTIGQTDGARVIAMSLSERPWVHVVDDTVTDASTHHGYSVRVPPHGEPRMSSPDGTYEENRFGVLRGDAVARRQSERWGPILARWGEYSVEADTPLSAGLFAPQATTTTSTSFVGLWDSGKTAWSSTQPGIVLAGHYAGRYREAEDARLLGLYARALPVRVHVRYIKGIDTTAAATVRAQSSSRSVVDIAIPSGAQTSYTWASAIGWLEVTQHPVDGEADVYANLQLFFRNEATGSLSVTDVIVEFGHHPAV